jgi:hypothetical protein
MLPPDERGTSGNDVGKRPLGRATKGTFPNSENPPALNEESAAIPVISGAVAGDRRTRRPRAFTFDAPNHFAVPRSNGCGAGTVGQGETSRGDKPLSRENVQF